VPRRTTPPPDSLVYLGRALRALREDRGLKQIEVAIRADAAESQVSDIERARSNPGWIVVARLLDAMGVTVAEFAEAYAAAERRGLE
jgi:transcriptional regulator with XRE-family HTH domain